MKYIVKKGDTLSKIARDHYSGEGKKDWTDILAANRDVVKNPDLIYPGQELDLPDDVFDFGDWLKNLITIEKK